MHKFPKEGVLAVEVRLFATLRENRGQVVDVQWNKGMSGFDLLTALDISDEDVKIFLINGVHSKPDAILKAEDVIALFPAVGGG